MKKFELVFDKVILKQLKKAGKNNFMKNVLTNIFDKIEELGPRAGKLLDPKLQLYEVRLKHPPIRLYYKHNTFNDEIYIFEYQMKTSEKAQNILIEKIRKLLSKS
jgi:mRNA-degrading endonuclease RelE of RelBE toxin-antitoxin system